MDSLLTLAINAQGGLHRWREFNTNSAHQAGMDYLVLQTLAKMQKEVGEWEAITANTDH